MKYIAWVKVQEGPRDEETMLVSKVNEQVSIVLEIEFFTQMLWTKVILPDGGISWFRGTMRDTSEPIVLSPPEVRGSRA